MNRLSRRQRASGRAATDAYKCASLQVREQWCQLDETVAPSDRVVVYRDLQRAYECMAGFVTPERVPAGYAGDLVKDLQAAAELCWFLGTNEYWLAWEYRGQSNPVSLLKAVPAVSGNPDLASAWARFWNEPDRARRVQLLRGSPVESGELHAAKGIIGLTRLHAGDVVAAVLVSVALSEERLAGQRSTGVAGPRPLTGVAP